MTLTQKLSTFWVLLCLAVFAEAAESIAGAPAAVVKFNLASSDPWVWVMGGVGAAIVYVKKESTSRVDAITNGVISIMLAGIVAPELAEFVGVQVSPVLNTPYPFAFLMSAAWPWLLPLVQSLAAIGAKTLGGGE